MVNLVWICGPYGRMNPTAILLIFLWIFGERISADVRPSTARNRLRRRTWVRGFGWGAPAMPQPPFPLWTVQAGNASQWRCLCREIRNWRLLMRKVKWYRARQLVPNKNPRMIAVVAPLYRSGVSLLVAFVAVSALWHREAHGLT